MTCNKPINYIYFPTNSYLNWETDKCIAWCELNIIWLTAGGGPHKHKHTHTYSGVPQPFRHIGPHSLSPFCSIHLSRTPPSQISGLSNSKTAGHICHIQYPTWNDRLQQIASLFSICEFFNVEKCKDIKYFLSLIFQDILGTSCNTKSKFISLNSYSNTD